MGCGCKKSKSNTVENPTEISVNLNEVTTDQKVNFSLTEEQKKTVDEIITRLNQVSAT